MTSDFSHVIAAVKDEEGFCSALLEMPEWIFDLSPDIASLKARAEAAHRANKKYFIHFDLTSGIGKDKSGLLYAKNAGIDGIISTRVNIIRSAKELSIFTVQRFFIVDSHSISTTLEAISSAKPDMMEIMPGIMPKVIRSLYERTTIPMIAGGLIESDDELQSAIASGARAVSTSRVSLWK